MAGMDVASMDMVGSNSNLACMRRGAGTYKMLSRAESFL